MGYIACNKSQYASLLNILNPVLNNRKLMYGKAFMAVLLQLTLIDPGAFHQCGRSFQPSILGSSCVSFHYIVDRCAKSEILLGAGNKYGVTICVNS